MELGFKIEVCFARPGRAAVVEVEIGPETTVREAIERSGLLERCPELDLSKCGFGSFGRVLKPDDVLTPGDRLEIYRPLLTDPKEMRRRAARRTG